jgi:iron complex transport system substrate-binding protein
VTRGAGWLLAVLAALALLVTAGTGSAAKPQRIVVEKAPVLPARVTDGQGKQVTVRDVSRIVSLNGDITETIVTLGLAKNLAGVDISATYPEKLVAGMQKIGYQRTLAAEGILSLRPSLVIGTPTAGPASTIEQLRSAGVPVLIIPEYKDLDAGARKLRAVGRALGVPKRGEKLARQVETQIALAKREVARAATKPKVAFLYVRGTQVQQIGGVGSGADAMIEAAGGVDVGRSIGVQGFKQLTAESLVAAQPDVLLLLSAGLQSVGGVDGLLRLPGVAQTPAGRNRRVIAYDDLMLLGLGPRTGKALRLLIRGLHPEVR